MIVNQENTRKKNALLGEDAKTKMINDLKTSIFNISKNLSLI